MKLEDNIIMENINLLLEWLPDFIGCLGASVVLVAYVFAAYVKGHSLIFRFNEN